MTTFTDAQRLRFLHTINKDADGFEWGVYRIKFDNRGSLLAWQQTYSNSSDLDVFMTASGEIPDADPVPAQPDAPAIAALINEHFFPDMRPEFQHYLAFAKAVIAAKATPPNEG